MTVKTGKVLGTHSVHLEPLSNQRVNLHACIGVHVSKKLAALVAPSHTYSLSILLMMYKITRKLFVYTHYFLLIFHNIYFIIAVDDDETISKKKKQ